MEKNGSCAESFGYFGNGDAEDVMRWALDRFDPKIALACSFQHPLLVHMALQIRPDVRVVAVDTGRLPEETYQCAEDIERRFKIRIEWFFPETAKLEELLKNTGQYGFKKSVENRKQCCFVRKIDPMNRALAGMDAWMTGHRRDQSSAREGVEKIFEDPARPGVIKICPIADWSEQRVRDYLKAHRLPYNSLMEKGFRSIGCECCTRALRDGENSRDGRWWWENPDNKECGLHVPNWQI